MTEGLRASAPTLPTPPPQTCSAAARGVISIDELPPPPAEPSPMHYGGGVVGDYNGNNDGGNDRRTKREIDLEDRLARVEGALAAVLHELHAQRKCAANNASNSTRIIVAQHEEVRRSEQPQRRQQQQEDENYQRDDKVTGGPMTVAVPKECAPAAAPILPPRPDSASCSDSGPCYQSRSREAFIAEDTNDRPSGTVSNNVDNVPAHSDTTSRSSGEQRQQPKQAQHGGEEYRQQAEGGICIPKQPKRHGVEGRQQQQTESGTWIPVPEKSGRRRRRRRNKEKKGDGDGGQGSRRTHRRTDTGDSRTSTSSFGSSLGSSSSSISSSGGIDTGTPQSPKSVTSSPATPPHTPTPPLLVPRIERDGSGCCSSSSAAVPPLSPWPDGRPTPPSASSSGGNGGRRRRGRSRSTRQQGGHFGDHGEEGQAPASPIPPGSGGPGIDPDGSPPGTPPPAVEYRNFSDAHVEELRRRSNSVTNNNNNNGNNPNNPSNDSSASEVAGGGGGGGEAKKKKKENFECHEKKDDDGDRDRREEERRRRREGGHDSQPQDQILLLHPPPGASQLRHRRVTAIDRSHDSSSTVTATAAAQPQPPRTALEVMSESSSNRTSPSTGSAPDDKTPSSLGSSNAEKTAVLPTRQVTNRPPGGLPPRPAPPSRSSSSKSPPPRKGAVAIKSKQVKVAPTTGIASTGVTPASANGKKPDAAPSSASSAAALTQPSPSIKPIPSFVDYVRVEMLGNGAEGSPEKDCDRNMEEFLRVPSRLEALLVFGLLVCTDSFLNVLTVLPLKFARSLADLTWTVLRGRRNTRLVFHRRHLYQLLQGFIIAFVSYFLLQISVGMLYHWIRGQTMLKLYLIMAIVEVFDRLMCSFGQDALDSLYWNTTRRPHHPRMIVSVVVVLVYAVLHSLVLFVHIATLNVAMNSADQALLSLLIGGNFAEIKSTVFKKYNKQNLFNITTADICERFKLVLFLFLILLLNFFQGGNSVAIVKAFLTMSVLVLTSEVLSDWIKHSFITKFNHIRSSVYRDYSLIIAGDVTGIGHEGVDLDHTHAVVKRVGLAQIPLVCVAARYLREALRYSYLTYGDGDVGRMVRGTVLIFLALLVVKVVLGMVLTATAARILERERRRGGEGGCDSPPVGPVDPSKKPKRPVV